MPTVSICCNDLDDRARRTTALRLTRWFANHDTDPRHVVVHFRDWPRGTGFVGGLPAERLPEQGSEAPAEPDGAPPVSLAAVECWIASRRDREYRNALAHAIADALGLKAGTRFFHLQFHPVEPADAYVLTNGALRNAEGPDAHNTPEQTIEVLR